jgi:hypothetical protein
MSQITLSDVLVLETHVKDQNKKNDHGEWEKTGKVYLSASIWQFGNQKPAAIQLDLKPNQFDEVKGLCGKRVSLNVDMRLTDYGPKFDFLTVAK